MDTSIASDLQTKAKLFRGFSDLSRLAILETLTTGSKNVTELIQATGLTQSNLSNHLGCLRDCGLVKAEQRGRFVYYRLSDNRIADIIELATALVADKARGVYECTHYASPSDEINKRND